MKKQLKNGERIQIGTNGTVSTYIEKSGDGKTIRFVRETKDGFEVFRTIPASEY